MAVSHYQVEGDDPCDFTEWEAAGRTNGGACGAAVGSWERYEEDVDLALSIGANAFRFSVSWSRVERERGRFDDAALARYRRLVDHCVRLGVTPVVTLLHYTHPVWFHRETPWTDRASVPAFARFARRVAEALGDGVRVYTVLNEPLVMLLGGFLDGQIPPGLADPRALGLALGNVYAAHAEAANEIRDVSSAAAVGLAHNVMAFAPERPRNPLDRLLARIAHGFYNRDFLEAFLTGRWDLYLPPFTRLRGRNPDLAGSLDFIGVNYYSRLHLRFPGRLRGVADFGYRDRTGRGLTDNGWEIVPEDFEPLLVELSGYGLPLLVSENGLADAADRHRARFLEEHVAAVLRANAQGANVSGYFHWSLVDNFEWLDGYGPKFGLFAVDRQTMKRSPRPSAEAFTALARRFI
ncbi:MAG: glycoside hydrolase family 1 protein [Acidobacteria bacterium]|nr:glycoside hydrolase family 1 protein [Acidobacteriota bacterium]